MKNFSKLNLFGLVVILFGALIFMGLDSLEAKKPDNPGKKPPSWEWKVGIPNSAMAAEEGCNLYANPHGNPSGTLGNSEYITYEKNDFVGVEYWTSEDKDTGEFHSIFSLRLKNTEKGISDNPGYYSIGVRDLQFIGCRTYCSQGGEGPCRCYVLPNYSDGGEECCAVPCSGPGSSGFWVMEEFMEASAHPRNGYDHFGLRFWVNTNIEALETGETWEGEGYIWWLNIWNTSDILLTGSEKYHNIEPQWSVALEGVEVYRSGENEWIITVDQCGVEAAECPPSQHGHSGRYIAFWETYYQGIEKQKGKSGKTYIDSEYRRALGAATAFKFITKWTRY